MPKNLAQPIHVPADIVLARRLVRNKALELGFNVVGQTMIVTAASELARNTLIYGKGGEMILSVLENGSRKGLELIFSDRGPGIQDVKLALQDGYTTGGGMGLGLSGAKRLSNDFEIESTVGVGTKVTIRRWAK